MKIRYLLCPGYVFSKFDGDRHFISAEKLKDLYGVDWPDCDVLKPGINLNKYKYIYLFPRYDGNYCKMPKLSTRIPQ